MNDLSSLQIASRGQEYILDCVFLFLRILYKIENIEHISFFKNKLF